MALLTCAQCGEEREVAQRHMAGVFCGSCAAERRQAIHRILKLRPQLDRIAAALACVRKLATVGVETVDWRGTDYTPLVTDLLSHLDAIERDLDADADEWMLLTLRIDAEGNPLGKRVGRRRF